MAKEMGVGATQQQMSYYLQIAVSDPDNGREYARIVAESENDSLAP